MAPVLRVSKNGVKMLVIRLFLVALLCGNLSPSEAKLLAKESRKDSANAEQPPSTNNENSETGKIRRMLQVRARSSEGILEMSMERFKEFVFDTPRNFFAFVMFYNDPERCSLCQDAVQAFNSVAGAYKSMYAHMEQEQETGRGHVFFVRVKMTGEFRQMLDLAALSPNLYYFAPSDSLQFNQVEVMDRRSMVQKDGKFNVQALLQWIRTIFPELRFSIGKAASPVEEFKAVTPQNLIAFAIVGLAAIYLAYQCGYWEIVQDALKGFNYAYFLTILVLWLLSGQMFNYMRGPPVFGNYGLHLYSFIYPGMRYQYGIESMLVMMLYGCVIYGILQIIKAREVQLGVSGITEIENGELQQLSEMDLQNAVVSGLSYLFFGFLALQIIVQIKT